MQASSLFLRFPLRYGSLRLVKTKRKAKEEYDKYARRNPALTQLLLTWTEERGETMHSLAPKAGMKYATLYSLFHGARAFRAQDIETIAKLLRRPGETRDQSEMRIYGAAIGRRP